MEAARMSFASAMPSIAVQEPRHHVSQRSGKGADFEGVYARLSKVSAQMLTRDGIWDLSSEEQQQAFLVSRSQFTAFTPTFT